MLRFCFGASGAGKSTELFKETIERSFAEPDTEFLYIVPDQFTMQTQKDVVKMHPSHAIMNIDVLSFGRLSHRIFEEVGLSSFSVLDDIGKSLIIRRVADILGDKLPIIGANMHKPGYIDEVKSTISEFMQYGIDDAALSVLQEKSAPKGSLNAKIKDLRLIYNEFHSYISGKYITTEETLDILCSAIEKSALLKKSVIIFDGFTGFTPIQYRVIRRLLEVTKEVMVSVTIGSEADPFSPVIEDQELFLLSKKTVRDLLKIAYDLEKEQTKALGTLPDFETWKGLRTGDKRIAGSPVKRLENNPSLAFLEENLFRYNSKQFKDKEPGIEIFEASNVKQEARSALIKITEQIRTGKYAYRDIAIVCGSLDTYSDVLSQMADKFSIPVYIDQNTSLLLNPFIEYLTSAINIAVSNYKYEDVFHYMRSGMTDYSREDTDLLENYVRALGIKGQKQWEDRFSRHMPKKFKARNNAWDTQKEVARMEKLESMRSHISEELAPVFGVKKATAKEITDALLQVIDKNRCREKLEAFRDMFLAKHELKKAKEFEQIYDKVVGLLTQISDLIGEDELELSEYRDILKVGIGDIEVGTIPQDVDRIIVGDIERTRLKEVKLLFFLGVNDGAIPSNAGSGGILSDIDRQYLMDLDTGIELAPTPRQQMYIQRLYLYMNLTKPTDRLILSYSQLDQEGKSMRPAYLIPKLQQMFPELVVTRPETEGFEYQNVCYRDSLENTAELVRRYAQSELDDDEKKNLFTLCKVLMAGEHQESAALKKMTEAAFKHYESHPLAKEIALALYGANLENSVSRLEKFASCCYAHFLRYGLMLDEREEFGFDGADLGNVFHEVLEKYTTDIMDRKLDFATISKEESEEILQHALTECVQGYGETVLFSSVRNEYAIERIHRILSRTVDTLKYQLSKGRFEPKFVEMDFREAGNLDEINIVLSRDEENKITESMKLHGRIDRVDLYQDSDHVYVKVIDYKSGVQKFSLASLYYGTQLQLVLYMNVAMAAQKKISGEKEVVPAAILYYHVDDPLIDGNLGMTPEEINKKIIGELKTTGLVSDDIGVIRLLDENIGKSSDVIPAGVNNDGSLSRYSKIMGAADYKAISDYVRSKTKEFGQRILDGEIQVNPYEQGEKVACTYCGYRSICGYDENIHGYSMRTFDMKDDDALEAIRNSSKSKEEVTD
jgi:ATP-dependent helicase/nuclease subunit B